MNLILHLPTESEAKLKEQAAATGQSPEQLALQALKEQLSIQLLLALSAEERIADVRVWGASHPRLPRDADDSRESIYAGLGK